MLLHNQRTVLIVDDCPEDREAYRRYLLQDERYRYSIVEEEYGEDGLQRCCLVKPDIILLDFLLPDIDGLEFLQELQELQAHLPDGCPPVIMLTGHGSEAIAVRAIKGGAQDYLVKDHTTAESLRYSIQSALEQARLRRQLAESEERFRTSIETMLDCFAICTSIRNDAMEITDFQIDYLNAAACQTLGMAKADLIGKPLCQTLPAQSQSGLFAAYCQVVETGEPLIQESIIPVESSSELPSSCIWDVRATKLGDGVVVAWLDITNRRQMEVALQESEARFRLALQNSPTIVFSQDTDLRYTWIHHPDPTFHVAAAIGKQDTEIASSEEMVRLMSLKRQVLTTGVGAREEVRLSIGEANQYYDLVVEPLRNSDGAVIGITGVATDITQRKQLDVERRQLLEREQHASKAKDVFLASVSHELRNPLHAILGYTQLLRARKPDGETIERALEIIERNAKVQVQLIDDLLDVSRITSGNIRLNLHTVNLIAVVEAAIDTVNPAAVTKAVQIQRRFEPIEGSVRGDSDRLQQIFWNLLSNAIKFSQPEGQIWVTHQQVGQMVQISVCDQGKGIDAEFLPHLFDRFWQAEREGKQDGLGLGLAIVRSLVELHGGKVWAESPGSNLGATFVVQLPLA